MNRPVRILYAFEGFHVQFRSLFRAAKRLHVNHKTYNVLISLYNNGATAGIRTLDLSLTKGKV